MSEVTRLRATLSLESRLASGLAKGKTELISWAKSLKGWAKPISDDAKKAGDDVSKELQEARAKANKIAYDMGRQIGASLRSGIDRAGTALTIGLTLPLIAAGKAAVSASSDLVESASKMEIVFGSATDQVRKFGETSAEAWGLSKKSAYDYASTFGGILQSTKLSSKEIAFMSLKLTELGADLRSFHNVTGGTEAALEKLRAGLTGEYEPLKALGKNLSEAAVQLKAVEMGFKGKASALTESQKMLARYALIMEKTKLEQGNFALTSKEAANQSVILKAKIQDQLAVMGEDLLPIYKDALAVGIRMIDVFKGMSSEQRQQVLKWALIAAAIGPALKLFILFSNAIKGVIAIRTAYVAAQTAMAAANVATGVTAGAAATKINLARLATMGLIALAAVPIIITIKAVYDFKEAADAAYESAKTRANQTFGPGDYLDAKRKAGDKRKTQEIMDEFRTTGAGKRYEQGDDRKKNVAAYNAREAAKREALAQQKAFESSLSNAFSGGSGLSGGIGKGGSGGAAKIKEVAKEYDYWGRVVQKAKETGFEPFRISLEGLRGASEGAESPLARITAGIRGMIEQGDLAGARSSLTTFVDSLKVEPKEIEGIVQSVLSTLGEGNEEFRAKVSASIGDARNLSETAKGALIEAGKLKDASEKTAAGAKARAETLAEFAGRVRSLDQEYKRLNATTEEQNRLLELQGSELYPKLTMWQKVYLYALEAKNAALAKEKAEDRERIARGQQLGALFASEVASYRERIVLFGKESEMSQLLYRLREGDLRNLNAIAKAWLVIQQRTLDAKTAAKELGDKWREWIKAQNDQGKSRYDEYIKSLTDRLLELGGAYDVLLRKQLASEITTLDPKKKKDQIDAIIDLKKTVENAEQLSQYLDRFADGAAQIFVNLFNDIGKGFDTMFSNLMSGFKNLLQEIAMEILKTQLKIAIIKGLQSAFGGDWSGATPKAMGGPVSGGRPYMVGERGPELFVPSGNGKIVPNNQLAGAGAGGMNVSVNITVNAKDANSFRKSEGQIASETALAVRRALSRDYGRSRS